MGIYLKKLRDSREFKALLVVALCAAILMVAICSCAEVGVVEPEVLELTAEMKEALDNAASVSDDFVAVEMFLREAFTSLTKLRAWVGYKYMSELDKDKCFRIGDGITRLLMDMKSGEYPKEEVMAYIRQRTKSLGALAESIGRYDHSDLQAEME